MHGLQDAWTWTQGQIWKQICLRSMPKMDERIWDASVDVTFSPSMSP